MQKLLKNDWVKGPSDQEGFWSVGFVQEDYRDHDGAPEITVADKIAETEYADMIALLPKLYKSLYAMVGCFSDDESPLHTAFWEAGAEENADYGTTSEEIRARTLADAQELILKIETVGAR